MNGEQLYRVHREFSRDVLDEVLPTWEQLPYFEREEWETRALEQTERDMEVS